MKKRVVSWLLVVLMLTSLLPTSVLAEMAEGAAQTPAAEEVLPETPEVPESPESPETPEEPAQPETPEEPAQPEEPEDGEQTSAPQLAPQSAAIAVQALSGSGTAADPYLIGKADDFTAITSSNSSGYFKLTDDITVTKPCGTTFKGTFDGDGHTVTLTLNVTSGNAGLFGETGSGAVIKNVVVDANVTSTVTGYSTIYGTAGLVGKVSGKTTVENCGVTGVISNTSTSSTYAAYVGGIVGYLGSDVAITGSYCSAAVSSSNSASSAKAGGLVGGMSYSAYSVTATDCYVTGDVSAKNYAGGFIGYLNSSSSKPHTYTNCYTSGTVTGGSSKAYGFAYVSNGSYATFENCYFNSTSNAKANNSTIKGTITGKTSDELKTLADTLGDAFQQDTVNLNNGYPILSWQYVDPDAKHTVSFELRPIDSVLTWNGELQAVSADGKYTFADVGMGQYDYSVTNEAGDYAAKTGAVTVKGKDVTERVELVQNRHKLSFTVQPEDAELTVKSGTTELTPESDGSYSVVNGTYTYTAELFGYKTAQGSVTVDRADKTHTVTMQAEPAVTVTFANADKGRLTVSTGERTMSPDKNGAYALPVGCKYDWTFKSADYAKQTGSIDLTGVAEGGTRTVTIPLAEKTAWGGADDIVEPDKTGGVYQISSGAELAWLAQEVNAGRGAAYNAVLTKDIDLGSEEWAPIGKNGSYAFKGTFDGQGYTIKGLKITGSASGNRGLFGYVDSGTVENVTVQGAITLTGDGSSSYGAGGIVGQLYGQAGTVRNCRSDVAVQGGQNVGGIVGYVAGGNYASSKEITGCVNTGAVSSNSYNAGGIVGYINGQATVDSCYNRGNCTSGSYRAGGIAAYLYSSYATVKNCYTTGVTKVAYGSYACAVVGNKSSGAMKDCFYISGLTADANADAKTSDELKALAPTLGDAFVAAPTGLNDGYPVLRWQIPTYAVTFTVAPADAVVTIDGQTGTHSGNQWVFKLPDGAYPYTVSAFGYVQQSGTVTVSGGALTESVTLTAADKRTVRFNITPADANAAITVTWNGQTVQPESDGSYRLPDGAYSYTVKAKGYAKVTGTLNVTKDANLSVELTPSTAWDGTPTYGYNGGFAGQLTGTVSGPENRITVKNVFGNCMQPDGPKDLDPVGNMVSFPGESQRAALDKMRLSSEADIRQALRNMLPDAEAVMHAIAAALAGTKDGWSAMDMTAYAALGSAKAQLSDAARQNVINLLIAEATTTASTSDRSRIELVLRALGADTTRLYPVNSNTPVDNAAKLRAADMSAVPYYTAPYVLLANMQGNVKLTSAQIDALLTVLENAQRDGMLGGEYGGQFYSDPDSTGAALAALAGCGNNSRAKALLETLKEGVRKYVSSAAYSSNANADAMIITGLVAAGVDPETVICADGSSIVTDLLRYVNDTKDGFLFDGRKNDLATEQGFRALIALAQFQATGKAFNIYDFSAVKTQPSHATGAGETETPEQPPETEDKITVTVTISTPGGTWLSKSVKLNKGSTVYHAFIAALEGSGISQVGAANGYVRSMTKDGVTYGEFTSGPNSGWLYKVNGRLPSVPLTQKAVNNGDYVLWYYTTDWKADPDAGKMADEEVTAADVIKLIDAIGTVTKNSGNAIAAARSAYNKLPADQKALVTNYDKLVAAEAAYAEIVKALQEDTGKTNETTGAWQQPYRKALDAVKSDELAFGSEWLVIALARSGREVPDSYYDSVVKAVQDAGGVLSDRKFTEYSRTILALTAIGKDPANVGGYDLLARLADMDDVTFQGLNGAIFALIALDSNKYDVPAVSDGGKQVTRDGLVAYILDQQLSDGGWALSGDNADPDMTAMALQALAAYRTGDKAVQSAVDKALKTLSDMQQADGGYSSWGTLNSESCAQVIIALTALGIDPAKDSRFAKNGLTVLDALLSFALDGGFRHTADGERNDMATEQALCALTAYARLLDGKTTLYDMTDVLGGQTPDVPDDVTPDETPKKGVSVAVWIVLGAAAVGGCTALVLTRRRRDE